MLALPNPAPHKGAFALLLHRGGGGGGRHTYPRTHTSQAGPPMPAAQRVSEAGQGTLKSWPFLPYLPGGCRSHCVVTIAGQGPPETLATLWSQAGLTSKAWWLEGVASKHLHDEGPQPAARSDDFQAAGAGGGRVLKRTRRPAGTSQRHGGSRIPIPQADGISREAGAGWQGLFAICPGRRLGGGDPGF